MNYADLNEFETKILNEILNAIKEKGYSPTVREIRSATNIKSTSTVQKYLNSLMKKGYITKDDNKNRTIEIVNKQLFESDYCENTSNEKTIDVPLLGDVAAGIPIFAEQNIEEMVPLPAYLSKRGNLFILKVRGDSMINMGSRTGFPSATLRSQSARRISCAHPNRCMTGAVHKKDSIKGCGHYSFARLAIGVSHTPLTGGARPQDPSRPPRTAEVKGPTEPHANRRAIGGGCRGAPVPSAYHGAEVLGLPRVASAHGACVAHHPKGDRDRQRARAPRTTGTRQSASRHARPRRPRRRRRSTDLVRT